MDCLTMFPLIVGAIGNVSAGALEALTERLLTILIAVFFIGGIGVFALTAFASLWIKHTIGGGPPASPMLDGARAVARGRHIAVR